MRSAAKKIMIIDDLANRRHDCDLLLDQNYYRNLNDRYDGLVPVDCLKLLGPKYILLKPEFWQARERLRKRDGQVKRILVFFGGSDPAELTLKALAALEHLNRPDISVDVVVGSTNPIKEKIKNSCKNISNVSYHLQVTNMPELISNADLALGSGGMSMWERCFLGLPAITVVFADNQLNVTLEAASQNAIKYLGWENQVKISDYHDALIDMISHPEKTKSMGENAISMMDATVSTGVWNVIPKILIERPILGPFSPENRYKRPSRKIP